MGWGDVRVDVENSVIWSSGDVAWVAAVGAVHFRRSERPVRLSVVLTRHGHEWLFRQIAFQWDESDPRPADLARLSTHTRMLAWAFGYIRGLTGG